MSEKEEQRMHEELLMASSGISSRNARRKLKNKKVRYKKKKNG